MSVAVRFLVAGTMCSIACVLAGTASASQLIERSASKPTLQVNSKGVALLLYKASGRARHPFVSGAINARFSDQAKAGNSPPQVQFKVDYSGGRGAYKTFRNTCQPYDGPTLVRMLAACKASDGSYWALQGEQTDLPNLGFAPWTSRQKAYHLQASHWTGDIAKIEAYVDWVGRAHTDNVFGKATYQGHPVYGFSTSRFGAAKDKYIRQLYLDTYNAPKYGPGWRRENSFTTHRSGGNFCYPVNLNPGHGGGNSFPPGYNGKPRGPGRGKAYRMFILGPGVSPDVDLTVKGIGPYTGSAAQKKYEAEMLALLKQIAAGDKLC